MKSFFKCISLLMLIFLTTVVNAKTIVERFGQLRVNGAYIENELGEAIQLTGIGSWLIRHQRC